MEERIDLREPELVPMRPEERREAVRLLAALIRADRSPKPSADANRVAESFPVGPATVERNLVVGKVWRDRDSG